MVVRFDAVSAGSAGSGLNIDFNASLYAQRRHRNLNKVEVKPPEPTLYDILLKKFTDAGVGGNAKDFRVTQKQLNTVLGKDVDPSLYQPDMEIKKDVAVDTGRERGRVTEIKDEKVCVGPPYVMLSQIVNYLKDHPDGYQKPAPPKDAAGEVQLRGYRKG
jgi:hypothetical protein